MKKLLLLLIVLSVSPALFYGNGTAERYYKDEPVNSILNWTEEVSLSISDQGFKIGIESYSDLVKNSDGMIVANSVQDVLGIGSYEDFNKGYGRFDRIKIFPPDKSAAIEAVVLFNLDIYSYYETKKDPVTNLDKRLEYGKDTFLSFPLILHINLADLKSVLSEKLGRRAQGMVYYFEPDSPGAQSGTWYPFSHLKELGDVDYTIDNGTMTVTVYKWPRDDRVHVGF